MLATNAYHAEALDKSLNLVSDNTFNIPEATQARQQVRTLYNVLINKTTLYV